MAILDGLRNAVVANTARAANKVAVNGLRNLVGNIFGVDLNPTNPAAKLTNRPTKFTTKNLAYPAGVEGDDMQGHYIIFEILEQNKAKLKSGAAGGSKLANLAKTAANEYTEADDGDGGSFKQKKSEAQRAAARLALDIETKKNSTEQNKARGLSGPSQGIQLSKAATTRIDTMIALYLPPSISVSYNSNYGEQEIGALAAVGAGAIEAFAGQSGDAANSSLNAVLDSAKAGVQNMLLKTLDTVAPGANALIALEKGAIITPRMELMFEGVGRRSFSYDFVFIPKDESEAKTIEEIVKQFKFHMASKYTDESFREMDIPSFFNIRYMHKGQENTHLNKISTCALESMDISYGADRFVAYEGGRPQTTKISLKFKEMEIITKDKIAQGF